MRGESMKSAFRRCMGEVIHQPVDDAYLGDIVRVFYSAWAESMVSRGDAAGVLAHGEEYREFADLHWSPDSSWRWW